MSSKDLYADAPTPTRAQANTRGWIVFAEPVPGAVWLALALMVTGILLLSRSGSPPVSTDA